MEQLQQEIEGRQAELKELQDDPERKVGEADVAAALEHPPELLHRHPVLNRQQARPCLASVAFDDPAAVDHQDPVRHVLLGALQQQRGIVEAFVATSCPALHFGGRHCALNRAVAVFL